MCHIQVLLYGNYNFIDINSNTQFFYLRYALNFVELN